MRVFLFLLLCCIGAAVLYVVLMPSKVKVGQVVDGQEVLPLYKVGTGYKVWTDFHYVPIQKEFSICNETLCPLKEGEEVKVNGKKYTVEL